MKIGVIGTPNRDLIIPPDGRKTSSWGGIVYNILPLAHYLRACGTVHPICPVGEEAFEEFSGLLQKFPNVQPAGLMQFPGRQNRVTLKCASQDEKEETAELFLPPLTFQQVQPHLAQLDFLIVNFTSGRDVQKAALRDIRAEFKKPILVDVHSLTLGDPDTKGRRRLIALRDWQEWLGGMDYIQFTLKEAACLTQQSKTTLAGLVEVADWLTQQGTKGIIVTRGAQGVFYFHADEQGILKDEIPAFPLQTIIDTTGCGDVFAAAFAFHLLRWGSDGKQSVAFANRAAALKATFSGIGPWLGT